MSDLSRTKPDLIKEITALKKRIQELELSELRRKGAEEKERVNEREYRIVADNTYDWEYWLDPNYRFIYCSPSCQRITGYKPEEFLADPNLLYRIIHPDHRPAFSRHEKDVHRAGQANEIEFIVVRSDGAERWIGHACQVIYDENGMSMGIRGSNRDITERKQVEEGMKRIKSTSRCHRRCHRDVDPRWASLLPE
jgi:PAS domain S-box-containing protein